jgi:TonB family protein
VVHVFAVESSPAQLPGHRWHAAVVSIVMHAIALSALGAVAFRFIPKLVEAPAMPSIVFVAPEDVTKHVIFTPRTSNLPGSGGGGGGNRQTGPIRRAEGIGHDAATLRVAKPVSTIGVKDDVASLPALVLDAKPLASGTTEQMGLPSGGVSFGTSLGSGSGGGVGEGIGTGIGSGRGSGIGPGSGGGIGGGVYRVGGGVTPPRVLTEVKPTYTAKALLERIQGSVWLELVVRTDGTPSDIRVIRSLDSNGLDEQAILAIDQWRFEPGRMNGKPVNVLVTVMIDFLIR